MKGSPGQTTQGTSRTEQAASTGHVENSGINQIQSTEKSQSKEGTINHTAVQNDNQNSTLAENAETQGSQTQASQTQASQTTQANHAQGSQVICEQVQNNQADNNQFESKKGNDFPEEGAPKLTKELEDKLLQASPVFENQSNSINTATKTTKEQDLSTTFPTTISAQTVVAAPDADYSIESRESGNANTEVIAVTNSSRGNKELDEDNEKSFTDSSVGDLIIDDDIEREAVDEESETFPSSLKATVEAKADLGDKARHLGDKATQQERTYITFLFCPIHFMYYE